MSHRRIPMLVLAGLVSIGCGDDGGALATVSSGAPTTAGTSSGGDAASTITSPTEAASTTPSPTEPTSATETTGPNTSGCGTQCGTDTSAEPCGDGVCDPRRETGETCPVDCTCGDDVCDEAEDRASCSLDCGPTVESLDWVSQDFVLDDPAADPYCVPHAHRGEQDWFSPVRYIRRDAVPRQQFAAVRVRAVHEEGMWTDRVLSTFDAPPYFEMQRRTGAAEGVSWGGDVYENVPPYVSIVGTDDGSDTTGWFNNEGPNACQYGDAWVSYDVGGVPQSPGDGTVQWSDEAQTPIRGVRPPAVDNCPVARGVSRTRWTLYPDFEFASTADCEDGARKRIDTIVSDHGPGNLSHHEVFYFTDVYGFTRWERWNCGPERQLAPPDPDYAALRCDYENSPSIMHMSYADPEDPSLLWQIQNAEGLYCQLLDCRDTSFITPVDPPGWMPAAWRPGAMVYFMGNILLDPDFGWSDAGVAPSSFWTHEGSMNSVVQTDADDGHHAVLSTDLSGPGWFSQLVSLDAARARLGNSTDGLFVHFGARVRASADGQAIQLAVVQWDQELTEPLSVDVEGGVAGEAAAHVSATTAFQGDARWIQLRVRLDANVQGVELDDLFVVISDQE
ncbi:MAG: hypothetical protein ACRBN8_15640 [Nannocystales bacterium]